MRQTNMRTHKMLSYKPTLFVKKKQAKYSNRRSTTMKFQKIKLYNTKDFEHRTPKGTKIKYFCISMTEL